MFFWSVATAFRGVMEFGKSSRIHTAKVLRSSEDLPLVIEIVHKPDRIESFLPQLDKLQRLIQECSISLKKVGLISYQHNGEKEAEAGKTA